MSLLFYLFAETFGALLFQKLSTEEGIPYTPLEGPGWLLIGAAVAVLVILVFVLLKVFKGLQRSRDSENTKEQTNSAQSPKK